MEFWRFQVAEFVKTLTIQAEGFHLFSDIPISFSDTFLKFAAVRLIISDCALITFDAEYSVTFVQSR